MPAPTVSAIITSWNCRQYIAQAIDSALNQTHPPIQVMVIDDSTDGSPEIVREYEKRTAGKVELIALPKCNVSKKRNVGMGRAKGDFIAFLDCDDIWMPEKTARQLELFAHNPDAAGVWCRYFDFHE